MNSGRARKHPSLKLIVLVFLDLLKGLQRHLITHPGNLIYVRDFEKKWSLKTWLNACFDSQVSGKGIWFTCKHSWNGGSSYFYCKSSMFPTSPGLIKKVLKRPNLEEINMFRHVYKIRPLHFTPVLNSACEVSGMGFTAFSFCYNVTASFWFCHIKKGWLNGGKFASTGAMQQEAMQLLVGAENGWTNLTEKVSHTSASVSDSTQSK